MQAGGCWDSPAPGDRAAACGEEGRRQQDRCSRGMRPLAAPARWMRRLGAWRTVNWVTQLTLVSLH